MADLQTQMKQAVADAAVEQIKEALLHRHVDGSRRFVGDQQRRLAGKCHRDHDSLTQAA